MNFYKHDYWLYRNSFNHNDLFMISTTTTL
jgi:hypothetical protein